MTHTVKFSQFFSEVFHRDTDRRVVFVRSFVFCGQGSSLLWTSALRPYSGPVRLPRERKGIGRCVRCVLATCRVKEGLSRSEQLVGYFYSVLCSNFVKPGRREISEIVRCLPDKNNKQNFDSSCSYYADCAKNLPGPAPNNVLIVLQISSKTVHFQRSYSRTSEHRQNAP